MLCDAAHTAAAGDPAGTAGTPRATVGQLTASVELNAGLVRFVLRLFGALSQAEEAPAPVGAGTALWFAETALASQVLSAALVQQVLQEFHDEIVALEAACLACVVRRGGGLPELRLSVVDGAFVACAARPGTVFLLETGENVPPPKHWDVLTRSVNLVTLCLCGFKRVRPELFRALGGDDDGNDDDAAA
jgi:hypothetical protein